MFSLAGWCALNWGTHGNDHGYSCQLFRTSCEITQRLNGTVLQRPMEELWQLLQMCNSTSAILPTPEEKHSVVRKVMKCYKKQFQAIKINWYSINSIWCRVLSILWRGKTRTFKSQMFLSVSVLHPVCSHSTQNKRLDPSGRVPSKSLWAKSVRQTEA